MPRRGYAQDAIIQANESRRADLIINGSNVTGNASQKGVGGGITLAEMSGALIVSSVIARKLRESGVGSSSLDAYPQSKHGCREHRTGWSRWHPHRRRTSSDQRLQSIRERQSGRSADRARLERRIHTAKDRLIYPSQCEYCLLYTSPSPRDS